MCGWILLHCQTAYHLLTSGPEKGSDLTGSACRGAARLGGTDLHAYARNKKELATEKKESRRGLNMFPVDLWPHGYMSLAS